MSFKERVKATIEATEFTMDMVHDTKVGYIFGMKDALRFFDEEFVKAIKTFKDMKIKEPTKKKK